MAYNFPNSPSNGDTVTVNGITYTYNSTSGAWKTTASAGGGGGASVTVSETAPSSPAEGDLWFDPSVLKTFVYYNDGSANQWVQSNPTGAGGSGGGGASVTASDTAPSSPSAGDLWYKSDTNVLYVYYNDGDSSQWVGVSGPAGPAGAAGAAGASASVSYANLAAFPSSPTEGDIAYAQDTNALYVYDGSEWDRISSGSDESPRVTTEPPTSHDLNSDGTTSTVTMIAEDPEGFDIEYGIKYNTSGGALPAQLASATTINQSTGVFTFTPTTTESSQGSFNARLTASDGNRVTVRTIPFDLSFGLSNVYGFRFVQTGYSYNHTVFFTNIIAGASNSVIHDDSTWASGASWSGSASWGNAVADTLPNITGDFGKFFVDQGLATFGTTITATGKYAYISDSGSNGTFDLTWASPITVKGILISGENTNNYNYWLNGYVQAYIGGTAASNLVSTQYTFVNNTVSAAANSKFYDFR